MRKSDKCITDGCHEQQEYSVVFSDEARGKYCKDCTEYFQFFNKKNGFYGLKNIKKLERTN